MAEIVADTTVGPSNLNRPVAAGAYRHYNGEEGSGVAGWSRAMTPHINVLLRLGKDVSKTSGDGRPMAPSSSGLGQRPFKP